MKDNYLKIYCVFDRPYKIITKALNKLDITYIGINSSTKPLSPNGVNTQTLYVDKKDLLESEDKALLDDTKWDIINSLRDYNKEIDSFLIENFSFDSEKISEQISEKFKSKGIE